MSMQLLVDFDALTDCIFSYNGGCKAVAFMLL